MPSVTQAHPGVRKLHPIADPTVLAPKTQTEALNGTQKHILPLAHVLRFSTPYSQVGRGTWKMSVPVHHYGNTALGTVLCLEDQQMARPIFCNGNFS